MSDPDAPRLQAIQQRLDKRQAPQIETCERCQKTREFQASNFTTVAGGFIGSYIPRPVRCECGGVWTFTVTIGGSEPTPDQDVGWLLATLARTTQERDEAQQQLVEETAQYHALETQCMEAEAACVALRSEVDALKA